MRKNYAAVKNIKVTCFPMNIVLLPQRYAAKILRYSYKAVVAVGVAEAKVSTHWASPL